MVKTGEFMAYAITLAEKQATDITAWEAAGKTGPKPGYTTEMNMIMEIAARLAAAEQNIVELTARITALEKLNAALAEKVG